MWLLSGVLTEKKIEMCNINKEMKKKKKPKKEPKENAKGEKRRGPLMHLLINFHDWRKNEWAVGKPIENFQIEMWREKKKEKSKTKENVKEL